MVNRDNFIHKLKNRDLKALDYLVDNYSDLALKVSYTILKNMQLSEECTNDILLKVWDNIDSFNGESENFTKWFVVVSKRYAIDILRKENKHSKNLELREELTHTYEDSTFKEVNRNLEAKRLKESIEKLDEESRKIIERRYFKNESIDEISSDLGVSKNAFSNRILRVKKKLKKLLLEGI